MCAVSAKPRALRPEKMASMATLPAAASANPADVSERIEQVATDLFIRNGYHGVSYLGIGKALGITHSNVHYHYRTKAALAEAVLERVARDTLRNTGAIWTDANTSLLQKFVRMRDWTHQSYLQFNPEGSGGRPWGLLSRFSMEADALTPGMRKTIRSTLQQLEEGIRTAVRQTVTSGELEQRAPIEGITLQIASVMYLTGQLTRTAGGFKRLDELMMWTLTGIYKAYGKDIAARLKWAALTPPPVTAAAAPVSTAGSRSAPRSTRRSAPRLAPRSAPSVLPLAKPSRRSA